MTLARYGKTIDRVFEICEGFDATGLKIVAIVPDGHAFWVFGQSDNEVDYKVVDAKIDEIRGHRRPHGD